MAERSWSEILGRLNSLESYFTDVLHKASVMHRFSAEDGNHAVAINAKKMEQGAVGILEYLAEMRDIAFRESGAVRIPVQNLDKPSLTVLEGGGNNAVQDIHRTRGKPITGTLPFGKGDRT